MRKFMIFALALAGTAWFADEASAQRFRGRGGVIISAGPRYVAPPVYSSYGYVAPASYYSTPTYWGGYTYPTYGTYYGGYYPAYRYPAYGRGGVWYNGGRWGVGVRW